MNLRRIRPGDIVRCDVRGMQFYARVESEAHEVRHRGRCLDVEALDRRNIPARTVSARQVIEHYSKRKGVARDGNRRAEEVPA